MNERIQRNGLTKRVVNGGGIEIKVEGYDVYDANMRFVIASVFGVAEANAALERDVRMSKIACSTGGCED